MYTYFIILNDYGIRPSTVWHLALNRGPYPDKEDKYDINDVNNMANRKENGKEIPGSRYGNTRYNYLDKFLPGGKENRESEMEEEDF